MITKTHKGDLGLGVPEKKKKKKKKVVKEPETQYSVLNSDSYFTEICPTRAPSPSKSVVLGQASEMPVLKKKKKKKGHSTLCEEHLEPETMLRAGRTEKLSSPRKQALGSSEFQGGEKKKKRKSLRPLAMPSGSRVKTSPDNRQGEEVTRVVKKPKKHKKEKAAQEAAAFSAKDPWFCEAGDTPSTCSVGKDGKEQAASGQKRKQGSPRECNMKVKKKKIHQKGDTSLEGHLECSKSLESSPRKGSKKPVKVEAPEYIPIGHNPKSPAKKKMKSKKKVEPPGIEEPALKRNKKKKGKESRVGEEPWEEDPDTDLEVVLEKKGNMDEAHIDQVRRKALQEEIDRESGKTEASEPRKWTGTQFGQWDTASFENEEQKLKFLKLMGGFKNGAPSFSRPSNTIGRPNMALSKKAADTLQQNLQQDYDRAMSWKYKRGTGLGFSTTPDKIFYIDRNASKSIKFED
ncbi:lysine-rich nucleolar protein 1 isoform X1 [Ursus americanus]|uniref:lysine-rich nucleolar protein 1 isoform X1 n=1 Tax=Ursus americanus TaxID=9643 RepID=UPI000E6DFCD7|nr:lysine-rich nucleolar protein 1 isoform X1 [Ursus americanus]XP_045626877.1 lysine-rich nucleolar protein 1 isoform X1 [Ursus americanus]